VPAARPPSPRSPGTELHFRPRHRLTHALQFKAVYDARVRRARGPITMYALPNSVPHPRLGLSVGTRVGGAVARNRLKRLLREAFRLEQHALPAHDAPDGPGRFDYVLNLRPHRALTLDEYRQILVSLAAETAADWRRRPLAPTGDKS
jgi:ribonuclease P protein component